MSDVTPGGPSPSTPPQHGGVTPPSPPFAHQPDIVRAAQKDRYYANLVADSCRDAVNATLGPRYGLVYGREIRATSDLLYHALTTGTGRQTLGEEFCDLVQLTRDAPPNVLRRSALVLLEAAGPYVVERLGARLDALTLPTGERGGDGGNESAADIISEQGRVSAEDSGRLASQLDASTSSPPRAASSLLARCRAFLHAVYRALWHRWRAILPTLVRFAPALRALLAAALRAHLALFYLQGWYLNAAKRLTNIRYGFVGRMFEQRPHYGVLGWMIAMQLGLSGMYYVHDTLLPWWRLTRRAAEPPPATAMTLGGRHEEEKMGEGGGQEGGGKEEAEEENELLAASLHGKHGNCPLCLNSKRIPTSTPCGHTFCWRCIAEWSLQKAECPICRASFKSSELACIYGAII